MRYRDRGYIYVFVRKDIPIEDQIVQVGHVALESARKHNFPESPRMVLLQVKDKEEIFETIGYLESKNINFVIFYEPDDNIGYSSIATEEIKGEKRNIFRRFVLWKY